MAKSTMPVIPVIGQWSKVTRNGEVTKELFLTNEPRLPMTINHSLLLDR
jgi:hypothetical protein